MAEERKFLVVDHDPNGLALLVRTLQRKFPRAEVLKCNDAGAAAKFVVTERFDAIIAHRAGPVDGETLIRTLRALHGEVPILMVSGVDRSKAAMAAGATRFLNFDAWLMIGSAVEEMITQRSSNGTEEMRA